MEPIDKGYFKDRTESLLGESVFSILNHALDPTVEEFMHAKRGATQALLYIRLASIGEENKERVIGYILKDMDEIKDGNYWFGFEIAMNKFGGQSILQKVQTKYAIDDLSDSM